jgi:hypothetical protein
MTARRLGDFALYVLIGVVLFLVIAWVEFITHWTGDELGKWVSLAGSTLIVFGVTIQYHRRSLSRLSFWGVLGLLLSLHLLLFFRLMQSVERWPYSWWMVIMPVEGLAIGLLLLLLGFRPGTPRRKKAIQPAKPMTRGDPGGRDL